jgi:hypothetical protein
VEIVLSVNKVLRKQEQTGALVEVETCCQEVKESIAMEVAIEQWPRDMNKEDGWLLQVMVHPGCKAHWMSLAPKPL